MEELPLPVIIGAAGGLLFQIRERIGAEGRRERPCRPGGGVENGGRHADDYGPQAFFALDFHNGYSTSNVESVVKTALRSGAYMASTSDGGVTYLPRVTARAW